MKNDLSDTEEQLIEDKEFLVNMDTTCATKEKEWEEIVMMRSQEVLAISEAIKILNDDDALELFKKTLPAASSPGIKFYPWSRICARVRMQK